MLGSVGRVGRVGRTRDAASVVAPVGKTYADFNAAIVALATNGTAPWDGFVANNPVGYPKRVRVVASAAPTGEMAGSPYGSWFWTGAAWARVVQHAMPSLAAVNALMAAGQAVYLEVGAEVQDGATPLDRNGYLSKSYGPWNDNYANLVDFRWWDDPAKKAWRYNPRTMSAPVEFVL